MRDREPSNLSQESRDRVLLYWSDELDSEERLEVEAELGVSPELTAYLRELNDLGAAASASASPGMPRAGLIGDVLANFEAGSNPEETVVIPARFGSRWAIVGAVAAVFLVGVLVASRLLPVLGGGGSERGASVVTAWDAELRREPVSIEGELRAHRVFQPSDSPISERLRSAKWDAKELKERARTL